LYIAQVFTFFFFFFVVVARNDSVFSASLAWGSKAFYFYVVSTCSVSS
jgi:hypothetical protein